MNKRRIAIALAALMTFSIAGAASATHTVEADSHATATGNPQCPGGFAYTLKIEDYDLGVGTYGAIQITAYDGRHVSWAIAPAYLGIYDANMVIVKGGPNAEVYLYNDADDDSDSGLTAPWNNNSGKWYGISHIQFCFDPKA
jgi:hypothetical protein